MILFSKFSVIILVWPNAALVTEVMLGNSNAGNRGNAGTAGNRGS